MEACNWRNCFIKCFTLVFLSTAVRGKSVNVYLMDGKSNGRMKCSLTNWTGVAYKIPRTEIENRRDI